MKKRPHKPESADIEFTADVKAEELRFEEVPETEVHPPAHTERENLPEEVRQEHAGITFRNVSVKVRIANELNIDEFEGIEVDGSIRDTNKPNAALDQSEEQTGKEKK